MEAGKARKKDPESDEKMNIAWGIKHLFTTQYKNRWIPDKEILGQSRLWTQVFNNMVKQGFIERKKGFPGYKYKWKV